MKRSPVSCERWCTAGCTADWPEVHGELSRVMAVGGAGPITACSAEWCTARSMRHRGQAVELNFFLLDVQELTILILICLLPVMSDDSFSAFSSQAKPSQNAN